MRCLYRKGLTNAAWYNCIIKNNGPYWINASCDEMIAREKHMIWKSIFEFDSHRNVLILID